MKINRNALWIFALALGLTFPIIAQEKVTDASPGKKTGDYFEFKGGNLSDFLDEIAAYYGVDLRKTATIPQHMMYSRQIPKMRLKKQEGEDFTVVLSLYNQISDKGAEKMGKWIVTRQAIHEGGQPRGDAISAIVLTEHGPEDSKTSALSVRAYALKGITRDELQKLMDVVQIEKDRAIQIFSQSREEQFSPESMSGYLNYHEGTGILIAMGSKGYVELAGAVIEAYKSQLGTYAIPKNK